MNIRIKRVSPESKLPVAQENTAGFDFFVRSSVTIEPRSIGLVSLGVAVEVPAGYFLLLVARSSTPLNKGLMLVNGVGVIDPFYNGDQDEVIAQMYNITDSPVLVQENEQLVQGVLIKYDHMSWDEVDTLDSEGVGGYWAKP